MINNRTHRFQTEEITEQVSKFQYLGVELSGGHQPAQKSETTGIKTDQNMLLTKKQKKWKNKNLQTKTKLNIY